MSKGSVANLAQSCEVTCLDAVRRSLSVDLTVDRFLRHVGQVEAQEEAGCARGPVRAEEGDTHEEAAAEVPLRVALGPPVEEGGGREVRTHLGARPRCPEFVRCPCRETHGVTETEISCGGSLSK